MIRLSWRVLAQHPMRVMATIIGLFYGAAVVAACGALFESAVRYHGTTQGYTASPVLVATTQLSVVTGKGAERDISNTVLPDRGRVASGLAASISRQPGVARVVPDAAVPVEVVGRAGPSGRVRGWSASGHPWEVASLAPYVLQAGAPPISPGQVVLDSALARNLGTRPGQTVRLVIPTGSEAFSVTGIASPADHAAPAPGEEPWVFFDDRQAQSLAGHPGRADLLAVLPKPGVEAGTLAATLRALLPDRPHVTGTYPRVYQGASRGLAASADADNARSFLIATTASFGGITLVIATIVIAGTVALSVQQRHRDLALLRAVAATPRQVRTMVLAETLALALLAGAAGSWVGFAATPWLRHQLISHGLVPESFTLRVSWLPAVVAVGSVALVAILAAGIASWRASRIHPVEALREAALGSRGALSTAFRLLLGLVALAGGVALIEVSTHLNADAAAGESVGTVSTLVIAVALLAPWLLRLIVAVLTPVLRSSGVAGRLAAANLAASARRLSPVVTALVLAISLGGSLWFLQTSVLHSATQQSRAGLHADQVITTPGVGLPTAVATAARRTPGTDGVTGIVHGSLLDNQGDTYTAEGVNPEASLATFDLDVTSGRLANLAARTVAVDSVTASALHLRVGRTMNGWFGDGSPAHLRVVAVYRRGLGFASFTLDSAVLRPHTTTGLDGVVLVSDAPGSNPAAVSAGLSTMVRQTDPLAEVATASVYQTSLDIAVKQNIWTIHAMVTALLVYVGIAALNTLMTAALARRRELALLRLSGSTPGELLRVVGTELAVLLGFAFVVGGAIAAVTLVPMVRGTTGVSTPYIPTTGWVAVIAATLLVGIVGTLIPVVAMLRNPPIEAIGARE